MERKYAHLVKPTPFRKEVPLAAAEAKDLEGISLNFGYGWHRRTGVWKGSQPHTHVFDELLLFFGSNVNDICDLGGETAVSLGREQEENVISESSVLVIPKGLPHGPFTNVRVDRPFLNSHILLTSQYQIDWFQEPKPKTFVAPKRHSHLIKPARSQGVLKLSKTQGPGNADQLVWFFGKDLEGIPINIMWGIYSGSGTWHKGEGDKLTAHLHPHDEVIAFIGLNPDDMNYLGAEIEFYIGKEHERYVFNKPTILALPKNLPHGPVLTRWVDKPYGCLFISLSPEYITTIID